MNKKTYTKIYSTSKMMVNGKEVKNSEMEDVNDILNELKDNFQHMDLDSPTVKTYINGKEVSGQEEMDVMSSIKNMFDSMKRTAKINETEYNDDEEQENATIGNYQDLKECNRCGAQNPKDLKKCWGCGRKLK